MKEMEIKLFIVELLEMEDDKFKKYIKETKIERLFEYVKKARH